MLFFPTGIRTTDQIGNILDLAVQNTVNGLCGPDLSAHSREGVLPGCTSSRMVSLRLYLWVTCRDVDLDLGDEVEIVGVDVEHHVGDYLGNFFIRVAGPAHTIELVIGETPSVLRHGASKLERCFDLGMSR